MKFIIFIFLLPNLIVTAQNQLISSLILSQSDTTIISHAHIINVNSNIGVLSNQSGRFAIQAKSADTLLISFVGYQSLKILVSEIDTAIYLERAIHTLESYTVLPYKNFNAFKDAFTHLEIKDTSKFKLNTSFVLSVSELRSYVPRALLTGGITNLASLFNKRIKDRKNYDSLLRKETSEAYIANKFNSKLIKQLTLLKEEYQIHSFMEYCDFTHQFIEFSSHYNLVDQILNCFEEYHNLPMKNK